MEIPHEKQFHFQDGTAIKSLEELKGKIERISYDEFYQHVNDEKNDFANWVEGVLDQKELARKLHAVTSIVETAELLNEALYPEETQQAEEKLGDDDIQVRIEEQLFSEQPEEELSEETDGVSMAEPSMADEEPGLPKWHEMEGEKLPGAPVTTTEAAHVPITERVTSAPNEPHAQHIFRQAAVGFVLGLVLGFILCKMLELLL